MFIRYVAKRGFTLIEALVAGALGMMILYVLVALLIPALRVSAQGTERVELDQRAALLEGRLTRALKETCRSGVGWLVAGWNGTGEVPEQAERFLSIHPLLGALSDSRQDWSRSLTVFHWKDGQLTESSLTLTEAPVKAVTLPWSELVSQTLAPPRLVMKEVRSFSAQLAEGPRVNYTFVLEKGAQELTLSRVVFLSNSSQ